MLEIKLPLSKPLVIHPEIAVCPYCQSNLIFCGISEGSYLEDGTFIPEAIELECITVSDWIDGITDTDRELLEQHCYMPYVYWLPVQITVLEYLQQNFEFVMQN